MSSLLKLPELGPGISTLTTAESERLSRRENVSRSLNPCLTCNDSGTFLWYDRFRGDEGDPSQVVEFECPCVDQWITHRALSARGVGLSYQRQGLHDATSVDPAAVSILNDWWTHHAKYISAGIGIVFHGAGGTGKTLSVSLMLKRLIHDGVDGFFVTFRDLLDHQSDGWRDKEDRDWFNRRIRSAGILVIDDIGKETHSRQMTSGGGLKESVTTTHARSTIDSVLRSRVADARPTFVTTNLELDGVGDSYSESVLDLLMERSMAHRFTGESFRDVHRVRLIDEIKQGLTRPVVTR